MVHTHHRDFSYPQASFPRASFPLVSSLQVSFLQVSFLRVWVEVSWDLEASAPLVFWEVAVPPAERCSESRP